MEIGIPLAPLFYAATALAALAVAVLFYVNRRK
jgi:hypothetical protein